MEFNSGMTLKENNIRMYTDKKDLQEEGLKPLAKCMEVNFGYTTRYFLLPELQIDNQKSTLDIDSSELMIEHARRKYKNDKQIEFEVFDIQTKNLLEKYIDEFDHVFSFPTVHFRNDYSQEFQNVYSMLKPGGKFHTSMIVCQDAFRLCNIMGNHSIYGPYFKKYIHPLHHSNDPEIEIEQLIERAGFSIEHFSSQYAEYKVDDFFTNIFHVLPFINELSLQQQEEMKKEIKYQFNQMQKNVEIRLLDTNENYNLNNYHTNTYIEIKCIASKSINC